MCICVCIYIYIYIVYISPTPNPKARSPKPDPIPKDQVRFLFAKIVYKFPSKPTTPKLVNTTVIYYMINSHSV